ncbi:MAG: polysaccharide biosynthesis tyrosine autokinase [Desulfomonile tiedjei]|nr:polysaccharide biosynthesis tyrosine autokinase [Desulfomonile tiedjei]
MMRKDKSDELAPASERSAAPEHTRLSWLPTGQLGGTTYDPHTPLESPEFSGSGNVADYLEVLFRRFWMILVVFLLILAMSALYTWLITPVYRSTATIEIERVNWKPKQTMGTPEHMNFLGYFSTQLQILKSRGLAQDFVEHENLMETPDVVLKESNLAMTLQKWAAVLLGRIPGFPPTALKDDGEEDLKTRLSNGLVRSVEATRVKDTDLAEVTMDANNAELAQKLLHGYLDLYLERNLEKRRNEHLKASEWLKTELEKVRTKLMASESALLEFITENGMVSKDGGYGEVMQLVNRSLERVRQSQETRIKMEAFQSQPGSEPVGVMPRVAGSEFVQGLKQQLSTLESEYSDLGQLYAPNSPKMTMVRRKVEYLRDKISEAETSAVSSALDQVKNEEKRFKGALDEAKKEAARINSLEARLALLKKDVDADRKFYNILLREYKEMDIRAGTLFNNISIVDPPRKPIEPIKPKAAFNLLLGSLIGLFAGVFAAFIAESMDHTIRSPRDIDTAVGTKRLGIVPDLAGVPLRGRNGSGQEFELLAHDDPRSPMSDAIKNIQTSLFLAHPTDQIRSMIVSSATPSEGKTLISVSIATILSAGNNKKTLLVDADLRKPRIHRVFGRNGTGPGLSTILTRESVKLKEVLNASRIPRFYYITSGPVPEDPVSLLKSERMSLLMSHLQKIFDFIVFDSPPVLGFSDAQILCRHTDGMIMVAKQGHVAREELREAMNSVASIHGGRILGIVLNKAHPRRGGYGYGYGGYYYSRNRKYYHYYQRSAEG